MMSSSAARTNLTFKDVNINTKDKLGEGSFRECFEGIYIGGHRNQQDAACKRFKQKKIGMKAEQEFFQILSAATPQAIQMAESWNEICDKNKKILLSQGSVYTSPQDGLTYLIEPLIRDCTKFNSNSGWVHNSNSAAAAADTSVVAVSEWHVRCMQAFSHFTYHQSGGQLVVCDLQGRYRKDKFKKAKCRFELSSDPAICSRTARFGPTDLGEKGIHAFFANHVCNEFCQASWSRPKTFQTVASEWFPTTKGTCMVCPQVTANPSVLTVKNPSSFRMGSDGLLEVAEEEGKENNKFATVANNNNNNNASNTTTGASSKAVTNNKKADNKKTNNKPTTTSTKTFTNIEIVGESMGHHHQQVVGEMGESASDWSSAAEDGGNNSGSDWSDDESSSANGDNKDRYDNNDGVYEESDEYEVAGDISNDDFNNNNSYDVYGDDYGSEYGDAAGDTTDAFFIGYGIGSDDEKIVGEQQSGDDSSDFAADEANIKNQDNNNNNEGENAIIFC